MSEDWNTDVPPNQLSINPRSACNAEAGWVRVEVPTAEDRRGDPMVVKLPGTVEPYFR
ncbi:DUF3297 family protein [Mycolicibacterium arenosum]|uniref:DUF3297 family protein n=1 Tax=Mycolicibacterium arenosum TaxID=2952157 RepID=A0ABT1MB12_9MYCO|nr:DUF3297 family protein [Mycolicibacterium sp. CAU 1645]MCP9274977.1 DUF3297 family protein [Mycolicibacterium sp. CAU 1645]